MSQNIAKANVKLGTDSAEVTSGLQKVTGQLKSWAGGLKGKIGGLLGAGAKGGIFGFAAGAGMSAFGAVKDGIASVGDLKNQIDEANKASRRMGVSLESWQGLTHAAELSGLSTEELEGALRKLRTQVDGPIDEALFSLTKRLEGVDDPGEKARIAVDAFGKSGHKMLSLMEGGEDALRGMVGEVKELGTALSETDAGKIEAANDAMTRVQTAVKGLFQRVIVAAAPALEFWSKKLTEFIKKFQPIIDWWARGVETGYKIISAFFDEVVALATEVAGWMGEQFTGLFGSTDQWMSIEEVITAVFKGIGIAGAYVWDTLKAGAGAVVYAVSFVVDAFAKLSEAFASVVELAKKLPDSVRPEWVDGMVEGTNRFAESVKGASEGMRTWGKNQIDQFGNSATRVNEWFDRLNEKKKEVETIKPKIDPQALEEVKAALGENKALVKGSKEEIAVRMKAEQQQEINLARAQLAESRKQTGLQGRTAKAIEEFGKGKGKVKVLDI